MALMEIDNIVLEVVQVTIKSWQRASKGVAPPGSTWEDLVQDSYVRILSDESFDPARGSLGARVNWHVSEAIRAAYKTRLPATNWFNRDEDIQQSPDVPVEPEQHIDVDAKDFVSSLSREDKATLDRYVRQDPAPRNSPQRRRDARRLQKMKDKARA